jgi:hypothetical protein
MSGRKDQITSVVVMSSVSVSSTNTYNSEIINIQFLDNVGIQANVVSGSPSGTLIPQVSADYAQDNQGNVTNAGNWVSLPASAQQALTSGSPANTYFDLTQLSAPWVRLQYVNSSGSGVITAILTAKMI